MAFSWRVRRRSSSSCPTRVSSFFWLLCHPAISCVKTNKLVPSRSKSFLFFRPNSSDVRQMPISLFHDRIVKACALAVATLIPVLAFAQNNQGGNNNNQGGNNNNQGGGNHYPVAPEVNMAWVLIPVAGAALLFSTRQFARRKR
jgi:hypothetical protein